MDVATASETVRFLYQDWHSSLFAYVFRLTGQREEAEDIVQDAFMLLYQYLRKGRRIENPRGWTLRLARRLVWKRKLVTAAPPYETDSVVSQMRTSELDPEQLVMASRAGFETYLAQLSSREAEVVLLRLDGLKYREIASALRISSSSVNTLLTRALRKLRRAAGNENCSRIEKYVESRHS